MKTFFDVALARQIPHPAPYKTFEDVVFAPVPPDGNKDPNRAEGLRRQGRLSKSWIRKKLYPRNKAKPDRHFHRLPDGEGQTDPERSQQKRPVPALGYSHIKSWVD